jgi:hypothetical protein
VHGDLLEQFSRRLCVVQEVIDACIERGTILYDYVNVQLNQHLKRSVVRKFGW